MLVLSRKPNESIIIGDTVEVKIVEVKGDYVKLGITAPKSIPVHRKEIYEAIDFYNLPVDKNDVYFTDEGLKGPLLQELGVTRHYEDQQDQIDSAQEHGVEIARVWHPHDWQRQKEEQEKSLT